MHSTSGASNSPDWYPLSADLDSGVFEKLAEPLLIEAEEMAFADGNDGHAARPQSAELGIGAVVALDVHFPENNLPGLELPDCLLAVGAVTRRVDDDEAPRLVRRDLQVALAHALEEIVALLLEAIRRTALEESVSSLFDD